MNTSQYNLSTHLKQKLAQVPDVPGVYLMLNSKGEVIYVGKAKCLSKRVRSYFNRSILDVKTQRLVGHIADIELRLTESEVEAFILENELIKRFKPQYNVNLKDGRTYPYLVISKEIFPRVYISRECPGKEAHYFGPFIEVGDLYESLHLLQEVFKFRTTKKDIREKRFSRPCLNYAIGRCSAPCAGEVSVVQYGEQIEQLMLFLRGKKRNLIKKLEGEMVMFSQELRFEEAARRRDQIKSLTNLNKGKWVSTRRVKPDNEVAIDVEEGLIELQNIFYLSEVPRRIEGIDISNTSGRESVGSVVHFRDGLPSNKKYRHFKIKTVEGANDYASIYEVVSRKYGRIKREKGIFPHIILIDGGRGQLAQAQAALEEVGGVPSFLVSIAKKEEELFTVGRHEPLRLTRNSIGLRILQSVRDESHRFAQRYHKHLRDKGSLFD